MEKKYLKSWSFNSYLIIAELKKIVKENGGFEVESFPFVKMSHEYEIENRTFWETEQKIENEKNEKLKAFYIEHNQDYVKAKENGYKSIRQVNNANYLQFYFDRNIYYIELEENPFFPHKIQKMPCSDDLKVFYNYYLEDLKDDFLQNIDEYSYMTDETIKEIATKLFEQLKECRQSEVVTQKKRINNLYDDGYHYEYIKEKRNHQQYKKCEN